MTAQTDHTTGTPGRTILSVDAMGGDQGPAVVVAGCDRAAVNAGSSDDRVGVILETTAGSI